MDALFSLTLLLAGCAVDDPAHDPPKPPGAVADADADTDLEPPVFALEAPVPGEPDRTNTLDFSGGAPLTEAVLYTGRGLGSELIDGCGDATIGIHAPEVVGTITTDEHGQGTFLLDILPTAANQVYYFQVVQPEPCLKSGVTEHLWTVGDLVGSWSIDIADGKLTGASDLDLFGTRVDFDDASKGDANGDGIADLMVAAVWHELAGAYTGATYLFYSEPVGVHQATIADAVLIGEDPYDWSGIDSAWAGDVNGDGFDDILIGARNSDDGGDKSGNSYLVLGPVFGTLSLSDAHTRFAGEGVGDESGAEIEGVGDLDGDGHADVAIGAEFNDGYNVDSGAVYLFYGLPPAGQLSLTYTDAKLTGVDEGDQAGGRIAPLGDINGDGLDDFAIGATGVDSNVVDTGVVYIVHGPVSGVSRLALTAAAVIGGGMTGDFLGSGVSGPGDVNGDGDADILLAARDEGSGGFPSAGAVYVMHGPFQGQVDIATYAMRVRGNGEGDYLGAMLDACDYTGDGEIDLILPAKHEAFGGVVYLFHGPLAGDWMAVDADAELLASDFDSRLGQDVACGGDLNSDGIEDFVIGAELGDGPAGEATGAAYTFHGR